MHHLVRKSLLAASALGIIMCGSAQAQSDEIEELRREYDQRLKVMQQAFDERLAELEAKQAAAASAPSEASSSSAGSGADNEFTWYWKEGLKFDSNDGAFKLKFNGRIQLDNAFIDADDDITDVTGEMPWDDGTEFRRARLEVAGTIYENIEFKAQYDFAGTDAADFKDVYMGFKTNHGTFRAGHFKEPFSLDELTSSKDIQFMERGLPNAFAPSRNTGLAYFNSFMNDRLTVAGGIFRNADNSSGDALGVEDEIALTGRITGLPFTNEDHTRMIHIGASASLREADEDSSTLRYRARPEAHITGSRIVDTGSIAGLQDTTLVGVELAGVYDRFAAQAEYIHSSADFDDAISGGVDSADFDGYYLQASFFLTDDSRNFKAANAIFDKIKPNKPFSFNKPGIGAWEILARYSHLDLNDDDEGVIGGEVDDFTVALNWYLNPNVRMGLNYVHSSVDEGPLDGDVNILQSRFQVTW